MTEVVGWVLVALGLGALLVDAVRPAARPVTAVRPNPPRTELRAAMEAVRVHAHLHLIKKFRGQFSSAVLRVELGVVRALKPTDLNVTYGALWRVAADESLRGFARFAARFASGLRAGSEVAAFVGAYFRRPAARAWNRLRGGGR